MKRSFIVLISICSFNCLIYSQSDENNSFEYFSLNFFLKYPRFVSSDIPPQRLNHGFGAGLDYGKIDKISFAYSLSYNYLTLDQNHKSTIISQDFFLNYYPLSIFGLSPIFSLGGGIIFFKATNFEMMIKFQFKIASGFIQSLSKKLALNFFITYNLSNTDALDGKAGNIFKSGYNDAYIEAIIGFKYYFSFSKYYEKSYSNRNNFSQAVINENFITKEEYDRLLNLYEKLISSVNSATEEQKVLQSKATESSQIDQKEIETSKKELTLKNNTSENLKLKYESIIAQIENQIVFFNSQNKIELASYLIIDDIGKTLLQNPDLKIELIGHADQSYTDQKANEISLQRADFIKNLFLKIGIENNRITVLSKGKKEPRFSTSNDSNRKKNNRVEFKIYYD